TRSGAHWTFLRPSGFAANTLHWAPRIRTHRTVTSTHPHLARPLIHEADIADVAVDALTRPEHHHQRTHHLTGPHHHTEAEQVRIIAQVLDLPLTHHTLTRAQATADPGDLPPDLLDAILDAHDHMTRNPEPATTTVEQILGRPARSYRQWVADHATDFR
ncbi:nucleoside-diphosphate sugar epimerase, partial [Nocardiopsis sp. CT-R113]|nr:nucleoside-diphosphate sugar epimerase [Nocardiopsis sp. CT-R113]